MCGRREKRGAYIDNKTRRFVQSHLRRRQQKHGQPETFLSLMTVNSISGSRGFFHVTDEGFFPSQKKKEKKHIAVSSPHTQGERLVQFFARISDCTNFPAVKYNSGVAL